MASRTIDFDWTTGFCNSATAVFLPLSPWMQAADIASIRCEFELRGIINEFQCQAAFQATNDVRNPGSSTTIGSARSTGGFEDPTGYDDVTSALGGKKYFRLGFNCNTTSGTNLSFGKYAGGFTLVKR